MGEIRVLYLGTGDWSAGIQCILSVVLLDEDSEYEAIS